MSFPYKAAILITTLALSSSFAQTANEPKFAELDWLTPRAIAQKQIEARGYTLTKTFDNRDLRYEGKILSNDALIDFYFNSDGKLVKISIVFDDSKRAFSIYKIVRDNLKEKYGPLKEKNTLKSYEDDDFFVGSAISKGSAELYSYWAINGTWLQVDVSKPFSNTNTPYSVLSYESKYWSDELKRRNNKSDL